MRVGYELTLDSEPISIYVTWKDKSGYEHQQIMFIEVAPTEPAEFRVGVEANYVFITDGIRRFEYPAAAYSYSLMKDVTYAEALQHVILRLPDGLPEPGQILKWVDAPRSDDFKNNPNYIGSGVRLPSTEKIMTIEEINNMPAGDQGDMLVAEKVMGWRHYLDDLWERMKEWLTQRREFGWDDRTPEEYKRRMMIDLEGRSSWPYGYSRHIDQAWLVINGLESKLSHLGVKVENIDPDYNWRCVLMRTKIKSFSTVI